MYIVSKYVKNDVNNDNKPKISILMLTDKLQKAEGTIIKQAIDSIIKYGNNKETVKKIIENLQLEHQQEEEAKYINIVIDNSTVGTVLMNKGHILAYEDNLVGDLISINRITLKPSKESTK